MLTVGIYIGRNCNQKGTIVNTTNVDSIRYAIQQKAFDAYSAELETSDKQSVFQIKNGYIGGVNVFHQNGKLAINVKRGNPKMVKITLCQSALMIMAIRWILQTSRLNTQNYTNEWNQY